MRSLLSVLAVGWLALSAAASEQPELCVPIANTPALWSVVDDTAALSLSSASADNSLGRSGVRLEFHSTSVYHNADFARKFDVPMDTSVAPVLSFNLFKIGQPTKLAVSIQTSSGLFTTETADLFDERNSISVDLTASDFATPKSVTSYSSAIVGLTEVTQVIVHLYSAVEGSGAAYIDEMTFCSSEVAMPVGAENEKISAAFEAEVDNIGKKLRTNHHQAPDVQHHISSLQEEIRSLKKRQVDDTETVAALRDVVSEVIAKFGNVLTDSISSMAVLLDKVTKKTKETSDNLDDVKGKFHHRIQSQHSKIESLKRHVDDLRDEVKKINHKVHEIKENEKAQDEPEPEPKHHHGFRPGHKDSGNGGGNDSSYSHENTVYPSEPQTPIDADLYGSNTPPSKTIRRSASTSGPFRVPLPSSH